jgi:hypothetical protein
LEEIRKLTKRLEQFEKMDEAQDLPDLGQLHELLRLRAEAEAKPLACPEQAWRDWIQARTSKALADEVSSATRRKFEVEADGKVTVHIEKGGNELTQTFESLEVMRRRAPDLHEHYEKLLKGQ